MKPKYVNTIRIAVSTICLLLLVGCAGIGGQHYIQEFEVTVVDAESGEPLEGVIMLAGWYQFKTTLHGEVGAGTRAIKEAVSDVNGRIHLPRSIEKGTTRFGRVDRMSNPYFVLYKEGYVDTYYQNVTEGGRYYDLLKRQPDKPDGTPYVQGNNYARWHKSTIRLERLPEDYDPKLIYRKSKIRGFVSGTPGAIIDSQLGEQCSWKLIPRSRIVALELRDNAYEKDWDKMLKWIKKSIESNEFCDITFEAFKEKYL